MVEVHDFVQDPSRSVLLVLELPTIQCMQIEIRVKRAPESSRRSALDVAFPESDDISDPVNTGIPCKSHKK